MILDHQRPATRDTQRLAQQTRSELRLDVVKHIAEQGALEGLVAKGQLPSVKPHERDAQIREGLRSDVHARNALAREKCRYRLSNQAAACSDIEQPALARGQQGGEILEHLQLIARLAVAQPRIA